MAQLYTQPEAPEVLVCFAGPRGVARANNLELYCPASKVSPRPRGNYIRGQESALQARHPAEQGHHLLPLT